MTHEEIRKLNLEIFQDTRAMSRFPKSELDAEEKKLTEHLDVQDFG